MQRKVSVVNLNGINYIVVDNEVFDWGIEDQQLNILKSKLEKEPELKDSIIGSIVQNLVSSFSDFLNKQVTINDINLYLERGYI